MVGLLQASLQENKLLGTTSWDVAAIVMPQHIPLTLLGGYQPSLFIQQNNNKNPKLKS